MIRILVGNGYQDTVSGKCCGLRMKLGVCVTKIDKCIFELKGKISCLGMSGSKSWARSR